MMKILIATHGKTASGMKSTINMFLNEIDITVIDAYVNGPDDDYLPKINDFVDSVTLEEKAYIFTDIYGGSVNQNVTKVLLEKRRSNIILLSNVNIPIIIELLARGQVLSLEEIDIIIEDAKPKVLQLDFLVNNQDAEQSEEAFFD